MHYPSLGAYVPNSDLHQKVIWPGELLLWGHWQETSAGFPHLNYS